MNLEDLTGEWWFPGQDDRKVVGTLSYAPTDGTHLSLGSRLSPSEKSEEELSEEPLSREKRTIYGRTRDGRQVSLHDATIQSRSYFESKEEEYYSPRILIGEHVANEPIYTSITYSLPEIVDWYGESTLHRIYERDQLEQIANPDRDLVMGFFISDPASESIEINDSSIKLSTSWTISQNPHNMDFKSDGHITITPNSPNQISNLRNRMQTITRYLSLGLGTGVYPRQISVKSTRQEDAETELYPHFIDYHRNLEVGLSDYRFTFHDVDFKQTLERFIANEQDTNAFYDNYFHILYDRSSTVHIEFLLLAVGLESYHDNKFTDTHLMEPHEYERMKSDMLSQASDDDGAKEHVENLLNSIGNRPSFKNKLLSVIEEHEEAIPSTFDISKISSEARDRRHDIAHGLRKVHPDELIELKSQLKYISEIILLREIGVDDDVISEQMAYN